MFYHPHYPFMLADLDYFVELPDGTTAILEIKTPNYNARDNWWLNGKETVPVYYESQGRHYMAVMNVDRVFYCCLYGNTEACLLYTSAFLYLDNFIAWFQKLYRFGCQYAMTDERTSRLNTAQHGLKIRGGTPA